MGVTVLVFAVELQKMCTHAFPPMFERWLERVTKWHVCGRGEESIKKNVFTEFISRYHSKDARWRWKKKSKWVSTSLTCTIEGPHEEVELSNTCTAYNAHSQHIESQLGKKQSQEKIPVAFHFSQLNFNDVTSDSLFMAAILLGAVRDAQWRTSDYA